jgi:hypothetical protein
MSTITHKNYAFQAGYLINEIMKLVDKHESSYDFVESFYKEHEDQWISEGYLQEKAEKVERSPELWLCGLDNENFDKLLELIGWDWNFIGEAN